MNARFDPATTALLLCDMQNDFLHPNGAYPRNGMSAPSLAALPSRLAPVAHAMRRVGGWIVATHLTLVPGRGGQPIISPSLKKLRPFLGKGDFAPGTFGHDLIEPLKPADFSVEKVAYSAFHQSRLEYVLRKTGIETIVFAGIVTSGGVASTLRDAHSHDFATVLLSDGCAAFDENVHNTAVQSLRAVTPVMTCAEFIAALPA